MLVKSAVLGGERCLDQMIGKFVQPQRIVVLDATRAHFVAVAVEESDGKLRFFEPVVVRRLAECRNRKREHDHEAARAKRHSFGQRLHEIPAPPACDVESVHELGEAFVKLASPGLGQVQTEVDTRIKIQEEPVEPCLPAAAVLVIVEEVAQGTLGAKSMLRRGGTAQPLVSIVAEMVVPNYGVITTR